MIFGKIRTVKLLNFLPYYSSKSSDQYQRSIGTILNVLWRSLRFSWLAIQ